MPEATVIELNARDVGIVVRDGNRFLFHAAVSEFDGLEGQAFRSARDAEQAVLRRARPSRERHRQPSQKPEN